MTIAAGVAGLAERAERRGDAAGAQAARARAIRTRRAAAKGRSAAPLLHVRHQAAQLLDVPRDWGAYLAADTGSAPEAERSAPPEVAVAMIGTDLEGIVRAGTSRRSGCTVGYGPRSWAARSPS
ncbi:hypothetical protein [Solirubrobacter deserti]|uniref:Uncharacterized protein n=1 Tax=Solirubrobacter deserti TaxID=2282478 RepID=A0ABT4RFE1_9ACTN|nr:hypothetical protein [Solirubrobacter deserti]MDA0137254.1 hypothetical protein [Solirubrobacter deserti]